MPLWTLNKPPVFKNPKGKEAVATDAGWTDPDTGEVLVAIGNLPLKAGPADVLRVAFDALEYEQEDDVSIIVTFNEKVDVEAGAEIEVTWSGVGGNFIAVASEQLGVYDVVFEAVVPEEEGTMTIEAQTIDGTITDSDSEAEAANLDISEDAAEAAGERVVPEVV